MGEDAATGPGEAEPLIKAGKAMSFFALAGDHHGDRRTTHSSALRLGPLYERRADPGVSCLGDHVKVPDFAQPTPFDVKHRCDRHNANSYTPDPRQCDPMIRIGPQAARVEHYRLARAGKPLLGEEARQQSDGD